MANLYTRYPIDALNLPTRARNALVLAGLTTPEEVAVRTDAELLALRGFGSSSLAHVRERLAVWAQERRPDELVSAQEPNAGREGRDQQQRESLTLLPGRQVLHATWFPGSPGHLFLWGEGKSSSSATRHQEPETSNPQSPGIRLIRARSVIIENSPARGYRKLSR